MKKILTALMLLALFVSCSSDDDNTDPNNNGNNNGMIDEKILGKWKVEHSKTIKGARFLEDGTLEIAEGAVITEYDGNVASTIDSYMFRNWERVVEFTKDNKLLIYDIGSKGEFFDRDDSAAKYSVYEIKDGLIEWKYDRGMTPSKRKYYFEGNNLIIEIGGTPESHYTYYKSKYSKITE